MRRAGSLLAALALALLPAAASAAAAGSRFSVAPRSAAAAPGAAPAVVTALTVGRHPGFDRVVLTFDGAVPGWSASYVPSITEDGSDAPVALAGKETIELAVTPAVAHGDDGTPSLPDDRHRPGFPALREVRLAGDFEGRVSVGIGVAGTRPFQVMELDSPSRLVLDIAHADRVAAPPRLTVAPATGPAGTTLTVTGTGCTAPGEPVLLVLRGGDGATPGTVGLGTARPDAKGRFRTTVTVPDRLNPVADSGGGPARPGAYAITTLPSRCTGRFELTAATGQPGDEPAPAVVPAPEPVGGDQGRTALRFAVLVAAAAGLAGSGIALILGGRRP
jgi:hypothetical protein